MISTNEHERSVSKGKKKGISVSLTPSKTPIQNHKQSSLIMSSVSIVQDENHISQMHNFKYRKPSLNSSPAVRFIYQSPSTVTNKQFQAYNGISSSNQNNKIKIEINENKSQQKALKINNQHDNMTYMLIKDQLNLNEKKLQNIKPKKFQIVEEATLKKVKDLQKNQFKNKQEERKSLKAQKTIVQANLLIQSNEIYINNTKQIKSKKQKKQKNMSRLKQAQQKLLEIIRVCDEGL